MHRGISPFDDASTALVD